MNERLMDAVVIDGHRINFSTVGEGPPLVLLPGNCQSSERWVETGYVERLSPHHRLILLDPLGHGESEKVTDRDAYREDALTSHIVGVLDHLGLDRVDAWGYSRGAMMLGAAARSMPDRFSHVVLGGIPMFDAGAVLCELGLARDEAEYDEAFTRSAAGDWDAFWSVFPLPLPDETKQFLQARNDLAAITAATWAARRDPYVFAPLETPTLAYWGDGEIFHSINVDTVAGYGDAVTAATIEGGHAQAFVAVDAAIEVVRSFLDGS